MTPNFDRIAHGYRWAEYLALGPLLVRARTRHLEALPGCRQALVLGDGDGRFTAALLARYPALCVEAVDTSRTMLSLLRKRCEPFASRLETVQADARHYQPTRAFDLVATHFFLDCLTQSEADALIERVSGQLAPGALWLVSDFRIPEGALHWPARVYIRALYLAFRALTGLRVAHIPDHARPMRQAGMQSIAIHRALGGMLTAELWQRNR